MQKLIIFLAISLMTLPGISRTAFTDTSKTCLPNSILREAGRLNEIRKIQEKELAATQETVKILDSIIAARDQFVLNTDKKNAAYEKQLFAYNSAVTALKQQIKSYTDWVGDLDKQIAAKQKELDKANRKRIVNKLFYGALAVAALIYSIFK